jgi:hypothetical protein
LAFLPVASEGSHFFDLLPALDLAVYLLNINFQLAHNGDFELLIVVLIIKSLFHVNQ